MGNITIGIAGNGWGFWATVNGISKKYNSIELLNNEEIEIQKFLDENQSIKIKIVNELNEFDCSIIICAGYKPIIKEEILHQKKILNIHYSLLPQYRGLHSTVWAILNNEHFLGYTVHLMNKFIDDGDILFQYKVENIITKTSTDYMNEFNKHVEDNIGSVIEKYLNKEITPIPQNKNHASWVGKRTLEDCQINFNLKSTDIRNLFRALVNPYPTPYFEYNGNKYFPVNARFHISNIKTHIGRILNIDNEGVWIKIKDGYIIFEEIYSESQLINKVTQFKIGSRLNENN